ncbi:MAG: aspartate kinase [Deltaproteobacteria bacterium]|jgi:aspartate kinase|nr:aspartate kinase [Gammaproteobacteria bacterium]MBP79397.1 aspartate kinase [Deltaproteobacteria bacterium]|tara:strand:+ start:5263 stop:6486 length:1224 start_codon:yes stop_codon:yes gene_type:complete
MGLLVQKFGGTSVGCIDRIEAVADKVAAHREKGDEIIVVLSAMSGETNRLTALAKSIVDYPEPREMDVLLATGEQVTIALLCIALRKRGIGSRSFTGAQAQIVTTDAHTKARIRSINEGPILSELGKGNVAVVAGFQGVDELENITTLGRGGSDTTAVALAAAVKADECQIYTDVKGVYTTDPRMVKDARLLDSITFEEMLELASLGAKVLQIRAVEFAGKHRVPVRVLSSFEEGNGTLISFEMEKKMEDPKITGIAFEGDEAKLTVSGVPDVPGVAHRVIGPVSGAGIEVDVIVQNAAADGSNDITFTVKRGESERAKQILLDQQEVIQARNIDLDKEIGKVSVVGVGMRSHAGIASKMFEAIANEGINIQLITTSEIKISIVIEEKYLELAVRTLHDAFGLGDPN